MGEPSFAGLVEVFRFAVFGLALSCRVEISTGICRAPEQRSCCQQESRRDLISLNFRPSRCMRKTPDRLIRLCGALSVRTPTENLRLLALQPDSTTARYLEQTLW